VELGTHDELLRRDDGIYARLHGMQCGGGGGGGGGANADLIEPSAAAAAAATTGV
jgi:hypothetical protein